MIRRISVFLLFLLFPMLFSQLVAISQQLAVFTQVLITKLFQELLRIEKDFQQSLGSRIEFIINFSRINHHIAQITEETNHSSTQTQGKAFINILTCEGKGEILPYVFLHELGILIREIEPMQFDS